MNDEIEVMVEDEEAVVAGEEGDAVALKDLSYVGHACHTGGLCQ